MKGYLACLLTLAHLHATDAITNIALFFNHFIFKLGSPDSVKCFFCNGGLLDWEVDDNPWWEHARWFPECGFLKQVKGMVFIRNVQEQSVRNGMVTSGGVNQHNLKKDSNKQNNINNLGSLTMDQRREVRAAMCSPSVIRALEMGICKEAIEMAIKNRLLQGNGTYLSWLHISI